jgi:hypothetical protein
MMQSIHRVSPQRWESGPETGGRPVRHPFSGSSGGPMPAGASPSIPEPVAASPRIIPGHCSLRKSLPQTGRACQLPPAGKG